MKRVFIAIKIDPSEQMLKIFSELKNSCRYDKIKWVELFNIHITLKFIGETEEDRIKEINTILGQISENYKPFSFNLTGAGVFGSKYDPRIVWIGVEKSEVLQNLANEIVERLDKIGFRKDRQNFVPHLTIGRIKFIGNKAHFSDLISRYTTLNIQEQQVDQFHLIESILLPSGPKYKILQSFSLQ
jgi:2'-5' RNA ligase